MAESYYHTNEIIFKKGDESTFAYVILAGKVEILRDYPENPLQLAVLEEGNIFGEMGLVDERPRSLTARAIEETKLLTITREGFVDLIRHKPDEALVYLRMFFERLRAMNMRVMRENSPPPSIESRKSSVEWNVRIFPLTPMAEVYISKNGLSINSNSFRVGRKSKGANDPLEVNDLIIEDSAPYNVSRNHFSIEKLEGKVFVQDRGSFLGTIVNGKSIGGNHNSARIELLEGENHIIAGTHHSPYKFKVVVSAGN